MARRSDVISATFVGSLATAWLINLIDVGVFLPMRANLEFATFGINGPRHEIWVSFTEHLRQFPRWWLPLIAALLATLIAMRKLNQQPVTWRQTLACYSVLVLGPWLVAIVSPKVWTNRLAFAILGSGVQAIVLVFALAFCVPRVGSLCGAKAEELL